MGNLADLEFRLSGGATNTDPDAAIGGAISTDADGLVKSQTATGVTTITGVTINDAAGNTAGVGTLRFDAATTKLYWTPPSGVEGTGVDVSSNGNYAIQGGNYSGYLDVTVVAASLPSASLSNSITIANIANNVFDDVSKDESFAGDTEYRCLYIKNAHGTDTMKAVKLWIAANTPGQDVIQIALDPGGKNSTPSAVANENTAPAGVNFDAVNPVSEASALSIGDLSAGDYYPFWVKRTVPALTAAAEPNDTWRLSVLAYI